MDTRGLLMNVKAILISAFLVVSGLAFASDDADAIAKLRQSSPWIPVDATVTKGANGTWKISDNVKVGFVDDAAVLGVWKSVDFVGEIDQFNPYEKGFTGELYWKSVEFQKGGFQVGYFGTFKNTFNRWTKGLYLGTNPTEPTAARYEIRSIADKDFLFIEWKSGDYIVGANKPAFYVFSR